MAVVGEGLLVEVLCFSKVRLTRIGKARLSWCWMCDRWVPCLVTHCGRMKGMVGGESDFLFRDQNQKVLEDERRGPEV